MPIIFCIWAIEIETLQQMIFPTATPTRHLSRALLIADEMSKLLTTKIGNSFVHLHNGLKMYEIEAFISKTNTTFPVLYATRRFHTILTHRALW